MPGQHAWKLRIEVEAPLIGGRPLPPKAIAHILHESMNRASENYPLPAALQGRVIIHWSNNGIDWREGEWSEEMTDSLNQRCGSIGWHTAVWDFISNHFR